jgi:hypothetical protein
VEAIVDDNRDDNFDGLLRHHQSIIADLERELRALKQDLDEAYEAANRETAWPKKAFKEWQKLLKNGMEPYRAMAQMQNRMATAHNMEKPFPGLIEPAYPDEQQPEPPAPPPPPTPDWQQLGEIVCAEFDDRSAHPSHY